VNLEEAGLLCQEEFTDSATAARAMLDRGAARVMVTDGGSSATEADQNGLITQTPPRVTVARVTGAGDTFMAAHIAAEARGEDRATSLASALKAAATYVSGEPPL
jgi:fructose-1-phosphate kinase PfkB-like protein